MRKKVRRRKNNDDIQITIVRYLVGLITVFVVVSFLYPRIITKKVPCANTISCKETPKFEIETNATGIYNNKPINVPNIYLSQDESVNPVLGVKTSRGEKHIYVNLATQTLFAYEGKNLILKTPVSTGLWGKTPTGEFTIWTKFRSTRMSGGSGADYYDLPNIPYVMFFYGDNAPASSGFSLHGTYWHNNFGHAMSHGCVNMKTTDAGKIFEWADGPTNGSKGTKITIFGEQS